MRVKGWGSAKDLILKGLWVLLSVADKIGEKNGSEDPPLQRSGKGGGLKPHTYKGLGRGSATNAWEMLARTSYVVNGNAANDGLDALNGHREN
jgi:hypothetical protein